METVYIVFLLGNYEIMSKPHNLKKKKVNN